MKKKQDYNEFIDKFKPKLTTDDCYTSASMPHCSTPLFSVWR